MSKIHPSEQVPAEPADSTASPGSYSELFALEPLTDDVFRSRVSDHGYNRIFGGFVIAQALLAAYKTVSDVTCHSLHCYFLRTGRLSVPVSYHVERTRDGKSFSTRRVVAFQDDLPIFNVSLSFQRDEMGFEHQLAAPPSHLHTAGPEMPTFPASLGDMLEMRELDEADPAQASFHSLVQFRTSGPHENQPQLQQAILAYVSDLAFMETALKPHGLYYGLPGFQGASIDHAIWFHHPPKMDAWTLFRQTSPVASSGRGLIQGEMFDADGKLIATIAQECLMRLRAV